MEPYRFPMLKTRTQKWIRTFSQGVLIHERYLVTGMIRRGGMGRVMLAQDQLLHRRVAMKIVAVRYARPETGVRGRVGQKLGLVHH